MASTKTGAVVIACVFVPAAIAAVPPAVEWWRTRGEPDAVIYRPASRDTGGYVPGADYATPLSPSSPAVPIPEPSGVWVLIFGLAVVVAVAAQNKS